METLKKNVRRPNRSTNKRVPKPDTKTIPVGDTSSATEQAEIERMAQVKQEVANTSVKQTLEIDKINSIIDQRVSAAIQAEMPKIIKGLQEALVKIVKEPPQIPQTPIPKGPISLPQTNPQTPQTNSNTPKINMTPDQANLLGGLLNLVRKPDSSMDNLVGMLTQARAISSALNPPSLWDRVMQNVVIRSLGKSDLLTPKEQAALEKQAGGL